MTTKVLIPKDVYDQNGGNVLAITGFVHSNLEDRGSCVFVEFNKDLSAAEKTTLNTTLTTKAATYTEVSK